MKIVAFLAFLLVSLASFSQAPHQGRHIRIPAVEWGIQHVKLYRYK